MYVFLHDKKFSKKYFTEAEGLIPRKESLDCVDEVIEAVKSMDFDMKEWPLKYTLHHRERIAFDIDLLRKHVTQKDKIIDIGALPLFLSAALKKIGYSVYGLDIEPARLQSMIDTFELKIIKCNAETQNIPFENDFFDAVIFHEMFEHLRINPIFTMKEIWRVLKPEGKLFLSTPNLKSINGIMDFLHQDIAYSIASDMYTEYKKLLDLGHMGHIREYTAKEICIFLEKIGFNIEKIVFRGAYLYNNDPKRCLVKLIPRLSPFISVIATARK